MLALTEVNSPKGLAKSNNSCWENGYYLYYPSFQISSMSALLMKNGSNDGDYIQLKTSLCIYVLFLLKIKFSFSDS